MKQLITVLRKNAALALFLVLTLPFSLLLSSVSQASPTDTGSAPDSALFQTESTGETTEEGNEEEEDPDC